MSNNGLLNIHGMNSAMNMDAQQAAQNVAGMGARSLGDELRHLAIRSQSKAAVLEYLAAQVSLDLFKGLDNDLFHRAIRAAITEIQKL